MAFPLFKGATRVPTVAGVPTVPLIVMLICIAVAAMLISLWVWLTALPLWLMMALITKSDDMAFRIWGIWIDTKLRNRNKRFWRASSYSVVNRKRK